MSLSHNAAVGTGSRGGRPTVMGTHGVVAAGHYLAAEIGLHVLRSGGNAADAAAATGFALTVLKPHQNGIGGEVPVLVAERDGRVHALSGNGVAPAAATIEHFRNRLGITQIPGDGLLPALVPPAPATWILLLARFGTMRLADVLGPAVDLAEGGFGMYDALCGSISRQADRFRSEWPSSAAKFLVGGDAPELGSLWRQPDWAATFRKLIDADLACRDREQGLAAARDVFYRGEIAERIAAFCRDEQFKDVSGREHGGLLTTDDFAGFAAGVEEPARIAWRDGIEVTKCPAWTQGPVLLQMLQLLASDDLAAMGHNSADYIHVVVECMKLAFADRDFFYGDPASVAVPMARLMSREYADERRQLVGAEASFEQRPGGYPPMRAAKWADVEAAFASAAAPEHGDTTKLEVIDAAGNIVSATPSGGWLMSSPVVPGLGFPLGTRGQMFSLVASHPNSLAPGKRPRTTLTPSIALRGGRPWMGFGSPGGDCQDQWALQAFLNVVAFGMSPQEAVEAPTFWTGHCVNSFYPRGAEPGVLHVEGRVPSTVRAALKSRGHVVKVEGNWAGGNTLMATLDAETGIRSAAASPRLDPAYAVAW